MCGLDAAKCGERPRSLAVRCVGQADAAAQQQPLDEVQALRADRGVAVAGSSRLEDQGALRPIADRTLWASAAVWSSGSSGWSSTLCLATHVEYSLPEAMGTADRSIR